MPNLERKVIVSFCTTNKIIISPLMTRMLGSDSVHEKICYPLMQLHASNVPGAYELLERLLTLDDDNSNNERILKNCLTEALAIDFVVTNLSSQIVAIESRGKAVFSPYFINSKSKKSCDFAAYIQGELCYLEVKDFSADLLHSQKSLVFIPTTNHKKREWIESKIRESFDKGANFLIARLSCWESLVYNNDRSESLKEVLVDFSEEPGDSISIQVSFPVPSWFRGVYLISSSRHLFVRIETIRPILK